MGELLATQRAIAAALVDADRSAETALRLAGDTATAERRLAIYRANVAGAVAKALGAAYPVVRQVVGEEFFDAMARVFQRAHPSTSGDLHEYGQALADFLLQCEPAQTLPYLADLARLEWAAHRAYGASDAPAFDRTALAGLTPEQQAGLRFIWADGTAIVESVHPIVRIWQLHQPGQAGDFNVDWAVGERALVARNGYRVEVSAVDAGSAAFIARSLRGAPLGAAIDDALTADAGFELGPLLARAVEANWICAIHIDTPEGTS
jgi:hypothetical protein